MAKSPEATPLSVFVWQAARPENFSAGVLGDGLARELAAPSVEGKAWMGSGERKPISNITRQCSHRGSVCIVFFLFEYPLILRKHYLKA
jgi:hypothetical protein